jgi:hypothetical protein
MIFQWQLAPLVRHWRFHRVLVFWSDQHSFHGGGSRPRVHQTVHDDAKGGEP